ncbi:MAG: hypothetical protein ABI763_03225 [Bacteroidota bacterium]
MGTKNQTRVIKISDSIEGKILIKIMNSKRNQTREGFFAEARSQFKDNGILVSEKEIEQLSICLGTYIDGMPSPRF